MQYEPPAINFPVRRNAPRITRGRGRVALGPGSRSQVGFTRLAHLKADLG
jgi:hypothetical protein